MNNELKFFTTRIAPNRNYTEIVSTNFSIKKEELDFAETKLLKKWFESYSRNACTNLCVMLLTSSCNDSLYLRSDELTDEVYACPDALEERLKQLRRVEFDFFKQIAFIKQPKF